MPEEAGPLQDREAVARAFGAENRNRLIDLYFAEPGRGTVTPANAWQHVYRLLLWSEIRPLASLIAMKVTSPSRSGQGVVRALARVS